MGVGISLATLAGAVARENGMGTISSAVLDRLVSKRIGRTQSTYEAAYQEVLLAKKLAGGKGMVAINIMVALMRDYEQTVRGALDAGVDAIISGAGPPLKLPFIQEPKDTAIIPIVSSARALDIFCKKWEKQGFRPDAVVLEGPLAGGHLGFKAEEITNEAFSLEKLFPPVKEVAIRHGNFPVIVAGGIYTHDDIVAWQARGADGVQMGTRFLATEESSATAAYKQAVVDAQERDILVVPNSPCKMPFRILTTSPMFRETLRGLRAPKCDKGYLLWPNSEGNLTLCAAKDAGGEFFCICNGLLSSAGYNPFEEAPLYTVGANAYRVKEVLSVSALMCELVRGCPE